MCGQVPYSEPKLCVQKRSLGSGRIARAVKYGKERVIFGRPIAQNQGIQRVHPSVMWAKFESLVEGARLASQELWS